MKNPKFSDATVNASANAKATLLDGGYLRIYTAPQPTTADTAIVNQTLLSEHRLATPAFGAASNGVAVAAALTVETSTLATGDAAWFRTLQADGTTAIWDGTIGVTDCDAIIDNVRIVAGIEVTITNLTITENKG